MLHCKSKGSLLPRTAGLLAGVLLGCGTATAQVACEAETASLTALAQGVQLDITAAADLRSGGAVHIAWRTGSRFPANTPAFLAVAIPGEVRVEAPPLAKQEATTTDVRVELPGVLALGPPGPRWISGSVPARRGCSSHSTSPGPSSRARSTFACSMRAR